MTADQIVSEARSWIGVPFVHQGRSRQGVDCAGLVICVARSLGMVPADFDVNGYTKQPDGTMRSACEKYMVVSPPTAGGVFMMRYEGEPQHMGFYANYRYGGLSVIHAVMSNGKVVEHRLDSTWRKRVVQSFTLPMQNEVV